MHVLSHFVSIRPRYELAQEEALDWLVALHTRAEQTHRQLEEAETLAFSAVLKQLLWRVGCKPDAIARRSGELIDVTHRRWEDMEIYPVAQQPKGVSLEVRQRRHAEIVRDLFQRFYPEGCLAPQQIIHVTCTGYVFPSGAQWLASRRRWAQTSVSHVYHMGCYAAIPALRMVSGPSDIVHTELSTLHSQPLRHEPEQLVVQSLFADGFIKYSVHPENESDARMVPHFRILSLHEELILDTGHAMGWVISDTGFCMTLSPEIPYHLKGALRQYLERLCQKADIDLTQTLASGFFAVHPGGPRILQSVQRLLDLNDGQLEASRMVLRDRGNMSSSTLPHIWNRLLDDSGVPSGVRVVSVAFGPGLTIAGALLEKVIPCG